ncbi:hypothetical protein DFH07DRAFT_1003675, partial [Mycena maculata]
MKLLLIVRVLSILCAARLGTAASCGSGGAGECVTYYSGSACEGELGDYVPTCTGNCFQYSSFSSIQVKGSPVAGTDCVAYSDENCQNEVGNSGNVKPSAVSRPSTG